MNKDRIVRALILAATLLSPSTVFPNGLAAGSLATYDPRELALLPNYCAHTQVFRDRVKGGNNTNEIKRWYEILGPTFHALHHYCWGLMNSNRALSHANDSETRTFYLNASIVEFDWVIERAQPDFRLLPEILTKKGQNLIRLGRGAVGAMELQRAAELKNDYWPAYAALSDYYRELGDAAKARATLEAGLSVMPDVKALRRRLAELDSPKAARHQK